jgi:hypothetical protein
MTNKFYNDMITKSGNGAKTGAQGSKDDVKSESTASWPGLPGKAGPDRSAGVEKVKTTVKSEGV